MVRYANKYKAPRVIESKFQCYCAETGRTIIKGQKCLYFPSGKKAYSLDSKKAEDWRNNKMDEDILSAKEPKEIYSPYTFEVAYLESEELQITKTGHRLATKIECRKHGLKIY